MIVDVPTRYSTRLQQKYYMDTMRFLFEDIPTMFCAVVDRDLLTRIAWSWLAALYPVTPLKRRCQVFTAIKIQKRDSGDTPRSVYSGSDDALTFYILGPAH